MEIKLSDGTVIYISEAVIAQDPRWRERLRELITARSKRIYG